MVYFFFASSTKSAKAHLNFTFDIQIPLRFHNKVFLLQNKTKYGLVGTKGLTVRPQNTAMLKPLHKAQDHIRSTSCKSVQESLQQLGQEKESSSGSSQRYLARVRGRKAALICAKKIPDMLYKTKEFDNQNARGMAIKECKKRRRMWKMIFASTPPPHPRRHPRWNRRQPPRSPSPTPQCPRAPRKTRPPPFPHRRTSARTHASRT